MSELLHFGYMIQWETFRRAIYTSHTLFCDDTTIPRQFFMYSRFSSVDSCRVWLLIRGYINQLWGDTDRFTSGHAYTYDQLGWLTCDPY
jgi:hypothetical protein